MPFLQILINPVQVGSSQLSSTNNSVTVSSVYNGPISSGQVSILPNAVSGSNSVVMHTIPIGSSSLNQVSVVDSHQNGNLLGSGKSFCLMFCVI